MALAKLKFPIILFGAAQLLKRAAQRHPEFKARLKEHNLVAQIMARDEEIGRWFEFKDGKITSRAGLHAKPDIKLMFKNAEIGASLLTPPINWLDQINAQKDFVLTVDGPEDLTNWFAQTLMMSQSAGLKYGTRLRRGVTRYCNMTNGGPVFVYVKDGKIVRMTPIDLDRRRRRVMDHRGQGPETHAAAQDHAGAARAEREIDRLFARPPALSDEARRLRSERRAQSAKPRQVRLRAHLLGRGDQARHRRDQAAEARIRSRRHHLLARLAPYLGQYRLLPLGAVPLRQRGRHDAHPSQSGFLGRLVLGRGASLGLYAARRPVGNLRHGRGLPAELRHDRVLGGRSGIDLRLLRRAGRHHAPAVAERSQARHQGRPRRSLLQRHRRNSCPANGSRRSRPPRSRWRWRSPMCGSRKISTTRSMSKTHTVGFDKWKAYLLGEEDGIPKTPEWQEKETGVPAKDVRALAREWGKKRVYLAPGGWGNGHGGACRNQTGIPMGARHGVPRRHAGARQARHQHGQSAMGHADRLQFLFPGLRRRRHVGRSRKHRRCRSSSTSACRNCRP